MAVRQALLSAKEREGRQGGVTGWGMAAESSSRQANAERVEREAKLSLTKVNIFNKNIK